jgi:hypothetical protein
MNGLKELAKQVGMRYREIEDEFYSGYADGVYLDELEAFAELVAKQTRKEMIDEFAGLGEWHCVNIIKQVDS